MLAAIYRFHGHHSVRRTMTRGMTCRGTMMMLRYDQNSRQSTPRCAVVVSKKVLKSAVKRNRVRRRIYNIVRHEISSSSLPIDMVFTVFSADTLVVSHVELEREIKRLITLARPRETNRLTA